MHRARAGLTVLVALLAWPAFGQDRHDPYDVIIPHATPPGQSVLSRPGCAGAVDGIATTAHGFRFAEGFVPAGRVVASVAAGGPADGVLREGDIVVSLNGHELVPTNRQREIIDPFSRFNSERGLYVYGLRDDRPFQALVWHCAFPEPRSEFASGRGGLSFHRLFPMADADARADPGMDPRMILAAYVWATSGYRGDTDTRNVFAPEPENYCRLHDRGTFRYTETVTRYQVRNGIRIETGQETHDRGVRMDKQFLRRYAEGFAYIHNDAELVARSAANAIAAFIDRVGCASPEFKMLERGVYAMVGLRWDAGPLYAPGHGGVR